MEGKQREGTNGFGVDLSEEGFPLPSDLLLESSANESEKVQQAREMCKAKSVTHLFFFASVDSLRLEEEAWRKEGGSNKERQRFELE